MASILKPFTNFVTPGNYQVPAGPLQIDWSRPVTNGLIGAWVPGAMGNIDISGGTQQYLNIDTNAAIDMFGDGSGLATTSSGGGYCGYYSANLTSGSSFQAVTSSGGQNSVFVRCAYTGIFAGPSSYASLCGANYDNSNNSPYYTWGLQSNAAFGFTVYYNSGGSQITGNVTCTAFGSLVKGVEYDVAGCFAVNSTSPKLYQNGIDLGNTSTVFSSAATTTAAAFFAINRKNNSAPAETYSSHIIHACYVWNRFLGADEVMWLHLNPYGFLIPDEYELSGLFVPPPPQFILMPQIVW